MVTIVPLIDCFVMLKQLLFSAFHGKKTEIRSINVDMDAGRCHSHNPSNVVTNTLNTVVMSTVMLP